MFSDQLIDQLSQFIIRPHRQIYGLDKLGAKKLIIKSANNGSYIQVFRQESTILSQGKKIQLSVFQPYMKPNSNSSISSTLQSPQYLTRSAMMNKQTNYETYNQITIFLHTNSGSRLQGLQYAKYLLQHGHIVCLFDYSGSGVSQGEYVSMGLNQTKDLANVVRFLQQKFQIQKVNLWGRSMGAVTAVLYSARYSRNVKKMVLDSPFCSFRQLVKQIVNSRTGLPEFLFGAVLNRIEENIKKKLSVNLMDIDLKQEIIKPGMQKIPIFFLISKDDKLVQPIHVETLYELHKGCKKLLYLQGSHNKPRPSQIRQQCAQFLCNKINNVSSQKTIEGQKKQYLTIISRKFSQDYSTDNKVKQINQINQINQISPNHLTNRNQIQEQLNLNLMNLNNNSNFGHNIGKQPFNLNLGKKQKIEIHQSSALSTPRDQHSQSKYQGSKISLSQLKKSQAECLDQQQAINQFKQFPTNNFKNNGDFKKQSRTMAIQYKNKIKQHINRM